MNDKVKKNLRWLAVIPASVIGSFACYAFVIPNDSS